MFCIAYYLVSHRQINETNLLYLKFQIVIIFVVFDLPFAVLFETRKSFALCNYVWKYLEFWYIENTEER